MVASWAARRPPLRRLGLEYQRLPDMDPFPNAFREELLLLWQRRPMLSVTRGGNDDELPSYADEASAD